MKGVIMEQLKARVLLWSDVKHSDMEEIDKIESDSIQELERVLSCVLGIEVAEPRRGILLELYLNTLLFCRGKNFSQEQTSVLLSIVKNMHQVNTETRRNNMDDCFTYCTELLLCHSVRRPPFSIELFSAEEVTQIVKYLINTYMRHYVLYKYIFTPQVHVDLSISYSGMSHDIDPELPSECTLFGEPEAEKERTADKDSLLSSAPPEHLNIETEIREQGPSLKSDLRNLVQEEVRQEALRITSQLEQQLRESVDHLNSALMALETDHRSKK